MKYIFGLAVFAAVLFVCSGPALAWGPGVHMALSNCLLNHLNLLPAGMAKVLLAHPQGYLYGCLAADIFIGKGSRAKPKHSHNWSTGYELLESSGNDIHLLSHALGYLSHLAADVVAHNYYIPNMLTFNHAHGKLSHVLLELKADLRMEWCSREAKELFTLPHPQADQLLLAATAHNPLRFQLKKRLYRQGLNLGPNGLLTGNLELVDRVLPQRMDEEYLLEMFRLSLAAVVDVMNDPYNTRIKELDPIGQKHLESARTSRPGPAQAQRGWPFPADNRLTSLPIPFAC